MNFLAKKAQKIFVDTVKIKVRGGTGGNGLPQYGGIGGKGGDVYVQGVNLPISLSRVHKQTKDGLFVGNNGLPAKRTCLVGQPGRDLLIKVPIGVTVQDEERQILGEINNPKDKVIVALGGRGGDKFNDNLGFKGQSRWIRLDLKTISDAVFVGFPNVGKSSLLREVSRASPKVADYPFTTLRPHLGVVYYPDFRTITMADLPGLVEGAHKNIGLGHEFLKHIVRTKLLVFVIDINNTDLGPKYPNRSPLETLCILNKEIELYDDTILNKPAILALSKMDTVDNPKEKFEEFKTQLSSLHRDTSIIEESIRPTRLIKFDDIIPISSANGLNLNILKQVARDVIDKYAELAKQEEDKFTSYSDIQHLETNRILHSNK